MSDLEWGYAGSDRVWSLRFEGAEKTLCGQRVVSPNGTQGFFPVEQPQRPVGVCEPCVWSLFDLYGRALGVLTAFRRLTCDSEHLMELPDDAVVPVGRIREALGEVPGG